MVQEILKLVEVWSNYNKKMMSQLKLSHTLHTIYTVVTFSYSEKQPRGLTIQNTSGSRGPFPDGWKKYKDCSVIIIENTSYIHF